MLAAIAAPAPRIGLPGSSAGSVVAAETVATGAGACALPFVAGTGAAGTIGSESGARWASTTAWTWVDTAAAAATLGVWDW